MLFRCADDEARLLDRSRELMQLALGPRPVDRRAFVARVLDGFGQRYNPGFLTARKSVTEAGDEAAVEWDGEGSIVRDVSGREWIDLLGGYGIYSLGIRHPDVIAAVRAQLERSPLHSQELLDPFRALLSELLVELAPRGLERAFFANSGSEAIEAAMKLAVWATGRRRFIAMRNGFHGKTLGSLALMGKARFRLPFEHILGPQTTFVPFGDGAALADALGMLAHLGDLPAAVVLEPVQGEGGAVAPPPGYLTEVRRLCDEHGVLFIADEVQTGLGRTGTHFAVDHEGVVPDLMTLGKSLGGGVMPIGALLARRELCRVWEADPFVHSSTFGGNPLACVAAIAAVHVLLRDRLSEAAAAKGAHVLGVLGEAAARYPSLLKNVRGRGLLLAMEFADEKIGYAVVARLFARGVLVAGTTANSRAIRIEPALNIPDALLDQALSTIVDVIATTAAERGA